jgi:hypothetical protein
MGSSLPAEAATGTAAVSAASPHAGTIINAGWENEKMQEEDSMPLPELPDNAVAGWQQQQQQAEEDEDDVPIGELPDLPDCPPLRDESQAGLQKHGSAVAEMVSYLFGGMMGKQSSATAATAAIAVEGEAVGNDAVTGRAADQAQ